MWTMQTPGSGSVAALARFGRECRLLRQRLLPTMAATRSAFSTAVTARHTTSLAIREEYAPAPAWVLQPGQAHIPSNWLASAHRGVLAER